MGDLLKLATIPNILEYAEVSKDLAVSRRLAVNTAVVAGVHLAWQNYNNSVGRFDQALFLNDIDNEISELTKNARKSRTSNESEVIQSEFKAFSSQVGHLLSYAKTQDAFGAFLVSLGSNPVPEDYQARSVDNLANLLATKYSQWEQGELEIFDSAKMQQRIKERKNKEANLGLIDNLLDKPVILSSISETYLAPNITKSKSYECSDNQ